MESILKTTLVDKAVEVFLVTPDDNVLTQFDFIRVEVDGEAFNLSNGFIHGTTLRDLGVLCKQTCIGLDKDLIFSVKESKLILHSFNLHLLKIFNGKTIPFKKQESNSWLGGIDAVCVDIYSTAMQALYFYFKRSASLNDANHVLCNLNATLSENEAKFMAQFLSYSPYLLGKADDYLNNDVNGAVQLDVKDIYSSLKLAVIQINNHRCGYESVMDAKHPTLSPLFKDNGPVVIDMNDKDVPL